VGLNFLVISAQSLGLFFMTYSAAFLMKYLCELLQSAQAFFKARGMFSGTQVQ
jgi:hypothetical protein